MTQETAKTAEETIVSTEKSTENSTVKTVIVANDGGEKTVAPTITFAGTPGSRRIRVEGSLDDLHTAIGYNPEAAPTTSASTLESELRDELQEEIEAIRASLPRDAALPELKVSPLALAMKGIGSGLSAAWLATCAGYVFFQYKSGVSLSATDLAAIIAGSLTPVMILWMVISNMTRGAEVRLYAHALRRELQAIIFPSEERAVQVNKDIERL
ncbi:MAG: hypothetical protein KGQ41_06520, partial [Alphaproteobacteria bacterium]|nr:hypothetical protein [Alphaproteobacteria bacterium]